ncbi:MAG: hypothetical protein K2X81_20325, partial [Candidatus Obscuribacterales bacterium]|nr:hypothetical protein [Candidatus Obscuribacterales bacterium]
QNSDEYKAQEQPAKTKQLKGQVQQSGDATTHLNRPLSPNSIVKAKGKQDKALDTVKSVNFELKPKSLHGKINSNTSLFSPANGQIERNANTSSGNDLIPGSIETEELPYDEDIGEQTINWEAWHKRFVESLYLIFHRANNGSTPGSARVLVYVRKDGALTFEAARDFYAQSVQFQNMVQRSFKMLSHTPALEFPDGSRREEVRFTINLKSSTESGKPSYGWTKGDIEKKSQ